MVQSRARASAGSLSLGGLRVPLSHCDTVFCSTVSNWENGNREPDRQTYERLATLFDVSVDYLMKRTEIRATAGEANPPTRQPKQKESKWIPVLGQVQAGLPAEAVEDVLDYEELTADMACNGEYFALQIRGDSMEPKFSPGDVVIVRRQDTAETGDIVVVLVNGDEATVKRIKIQSNGLFLIASNPIYDPLFYSKQDVETLPVVILGKVVELRAKF